MVRLSKFLRGTFGLAMLGLMGCAPTPYFMYDGSPKPGSEVARVTYSAPLTNPLLLMKVDGDFGRFYAEVERIYK